MNNDQMLLEKSKDVKFVKGYKFPIYPNKDQIELLEKSFGSARYVYNKALAEAKDEYEYYKLMNKISPNIILVKPSLTGFSFVNRLIKYKSNPDTQWLYDTSSDVLQQSMLHLGDAFSRFLKDRKGYPNFKKKTNKQSITLTKNVFRFKDGKFFIAKSKDPLAIGFSRDLPSKPSSCVITKTCTGKYYISFICEYTPTKLTSINKIGIDLGLKNFIVTSDGLRIPNPKHLKQQSKNLKRKQQSLSRKKKGSINRNKARIKVAKIHESITNIRNDFQHKLSRKLINENQVIGLESLKVRNMIKNRKLSKAISDVSWYSFVGKLIYKARESQNTNIVQFDSFYPSTHICNDTNKRLDYKLKLSDREWLCPFCNQVHDRDLNASRNIRDEAIFTIEINKITDRGIHILGNTR